MGPSRQIDCLCSPAEEAPHRLESARLLADSGNLHVVLMAQFDGDLDRSQFDNAGTELRKWSVWCWFKLSSVSYKAKLAPTTSSEQYNTYKNLASSTVTVE